MTDRPRRVGSASALIKGFRPIERSTAGGMPASLLDAIEATGGGYWWAGDHYVDAATIVRRAREVGTRALSVDARDLSFLTELPELRFLSISTEGRPILDPVASLPELESLLLQVGALRGTFNPFDIPRLRWLSVSLDGDGGRAVADRIPTGHDRLEWLALNEVPYRTIAEAGPAFPRLRYLRFGFADHLRSPGDLSSIAGTLRGLNIGLSGIGTLDGVEVLRGLEMLAVSGGKVTDLAPVAAIPTLRYLAPQIRGLSLEPLRGHPGIRMVWLLDIDEAALAVLETLPNLVAVGRSLQPDARVRWPNLASKDEVPALREEWFRALFG